MTLLPAALRRSAPRACGAAMLTRTEGAAMYTVEASS